MAVTENITVLFTDLVGSTELASSLSPEAADELRRAHFSGLRRAVAGAGATEVKNVGDGLMVIVPSASAAFACAVAMQQAVHRDNRRNAWDLGLRVGLSGGDVTKEDDDYFGDPVVEAARLCARAGGGQILTADVVRRMAGRRAPHVFHSLGPLALKGLPEAVETFEVAWEPLDDGSDDSRRVPLPRRLALTPPVGVIGRETEAALLVEIYGQVVAGQGRRVLLISGEPGMGKTTLAAQLAQSAFDAGACVLLGRCSEDLAAPYGPFVEALGHYARHVDEEVLMAHVDGHGGALDAVVPALRQRLGELPAPRSSDPDDERRLLCVAAVGLLDDASASRPLVLVLDDLQWADKPTLQLLRLLIASDVRGQLMIVATHRRAELTHAHPLTATLAALRRESGVRTLELGGLDDLGVVAFMEAAAGHFLLPSHQGFARALWRETDGNPFFVGEVLRHLTEVGSIYQDESGRWRTSDEIERVALPDSVREVIGARVARLGEEAGVVLSLAAVIGREFDLDVLSRVSGRSEDDLLEILDAAAAAALVSEVPDRPMRFSFVHALIQHTLDHDLGASRRAQAHRGIAEAMEAMAGVDARSAAEMAHHWFAGTPNDRIRGLPYAERAGRDALAAFAFEDAADWFGRALEVVDTERDPARRLPLALGLAEAATLSGQQERARDAARSAWDLARGGVDLAAAVRAALLFAGEPELNIVGDEPGTDLLEATLADASANSSERALVMARLGSAVSYTDHDRSITLGTQAIALARELGDPVALGYAIRCRLRGWFDPEAIAARREAAAELQGLGSRLADPLLEAWGLRWQGTMFEDGDLSLIEASMDSLWSLGERLHNPNHRWAAAMRRAAVMIQRGRFGEASALQDTAAEAALQLDNLLVPLLETQRRLLDELRGASPPLLSPYEASEAIFEDLGQNSGQWLVPDITRLALIAGAAMHMTRSPDPDVAAAVYPWARRHQAMTAVWNPGVAMLGSMHLYAGLLAVAMDDVETGLGHFKRAVLRNEELGAQPFLALSLHHLAHALPSGGEAEVALRRSIDIATDVGLVWLLGD